jgi:hypothetical protein
MQIEKQNTDYSQLISQISETYQFGQRQAVQYIVEFEQNEAVLSGFPNWCGASAPIGLNSKYAEY